VAITEGSACAMAGSEAQLKRGSVGLLEAVVMSAAFVAPAAVVIFGNIYIAGFSGPAIPLVYLISIAVALCIAWAVGELARKYPSAGAFYTWSTRALGPRAGFMTGWLLFVGYALLAPAQMAIFGSWTHDVLSRYGYDVPWWIFSLLLGGTVTILAIRGVAPSLRASLIGLAFEVAVLLILSLIIIGQGGAEGQSAQPFMPSDSFDGLNGVFLALVFGIWGFVGFESSATLGEEVRQPRRNIPIAVVLAVAVLGVYYVIVSYAQVIGYGVSASGVDELVSDTATFDTLARRFGGTALALLVDIAAMTSLFALNTATMTAITRIVFAMGREGMLPRFLGKASPRFQTPYFSIITVEIAALVALLLAGLAWGPVNTFGYLAFLATLALIPVYALIIVSMIVVYRRNFSGEFGIVRHAVPAVIGLGGLALVLKGNVWPVPAAPFDSFIYVVVIYAAIGLAVAWWLGRAKPETMHEAGMILADAAADDA
jgi:amino acid transporter